MTEPDWVGTPKKAVGDALHAASNAALFPAVEGLFAIIDAGMRDGPLPLDARYDAGLGYPTRIAIGDPGTVAPDYSVSDLRPE